MTKTIGDSVPDYVDPHFSDSNDDFTELEALIAAGGNSRLALSLRARRQLRDPGGKDGGQWIYMGGGLKRALRRLLALLGMDDNGKPRTVRITGTVTQPGSGDKNIEIYVNPKQAREAGIRSGFYDVDVSATSEVEAELSTEALQRAGVKTPTGARVTTATPDLSSITRRDVPLGWKDLGTDSDGNRHYETEGGDFDVRTTPEGKFLIKDRLTGESYEADDWVDAIATVNRTLIEEAGETVPESKEEAAAMQKRANRALRDSVDGTKDAGKSAASKKEKTSAQLAEEITALEDEQRNLDSMDKDYDKKDAALTKKLETARAKYEDAKDLEEEASKPAVKAGDSGKLRATFDELNVGDVVLDENGEELMFLSSDRKADRSNVASFQDSKGKTVEKTYGSDVYTVSVAATVKSVGDTGKPTWTKDNRKDSVTAEPTPNSIPKAGAKKPRTVPGTTDRTAASRVNVVASEGDEIIPEAAQDIQKRLGKGVDGLQGNLFGVARQSATKERKARDAVPATAERLAKFLGIDDVDITDGDLAKLKTLEKSESFKAYNDRIAKAYFKGDKNVPLSKQELSDIFGAIKSDIDALEFDSEFLKDYLGSELKYWADKYKLPTPGKKPVATKDADAIAEAKKIIAGLGKYKLPEGFIPAEHSSYSEPNADGEVTEIYDEELRGLRLFERLIESGTENEARLYEKDVEKLLNLALGEKDINKRDELMSMYVQAYKDFSDISEVRLALLGEGDKMVNLTRRTLDAYAIGRLETKSAQLGFNPGENHQALSKVLANTAIRLINARKAETSAPSDTTTGVQGKGKFDTSKLTPAVAARAEKWLSDLTRYNGETYTNRDLFEKFGIAKHFYPGELREIMDDGTQKLGKPRYGITIDPNNPNRYLEVPKSVHDAFVPGQADTSATPADVKTAKDRSVPYGENGGTTRVTRLDNGDIEIEKFGSNGQSLRLGVAVIKKKDISPSGLLGVIGGRPGESVAYHIPTGLVFKGNLKFLEAKKLIKDLDASDVDLDWGWTDGNMPNLDKIEALKVWIKNRQQSQIPATPATPATRTTSTTKPLKVGDKVTTLDEIKTLPLNTVIFTPQAGRKQAMRLTVGPDGKINYAQLLKKNTKNVWNGMVVPSEEQVAEFLKDRTYTVETLPEVKPTSTVTPEIEGTPENVNYETAKIGDVIMTGRGDETGTIRAINTGVTIAGFGENNRGRSVVIEVILDSGSIRDLNYSNPEEAEKDQLKLVSRREPLVDAPTSGTEKTGSREIVDSVEKLDSYPNGTIVHISKNNEFFTDTEFGDATYYAASVVKVGGKWYSVSSDGSLSKDVDYRVKFEFAKNEGKLAIDIPDDGSAPDTLYARAKNLSIPKVGEKISTVDGFESLPAGSVVISVSNSGRSLRYTRSDSNERNKLVSTIETQGADGSWTVDDRATSSTDELINRFTFSESTVERVGPAESKIVTTKAPASTTAPVVVTSPATSSTADSAMNQARVTRLQTSLDRANGILDQNAAGKLNLSDERVAAITQYRNDIQFVMEKSKTENVEIPKDIYDRLTKSKVADLTDSEQSVRSTGDPYQDLKNLLGDENLSSQLDEFQEYINSLSGEDLSDDDKASIQEQLNELVSALTSKTNEIASYDTDTAQKANARIDEIKSQVEEISGGTSTKAPVETSVSQEEIDEIVDAFGSDVALITASRDEFQNDLDSGVYDKDPEGKALAEQSIRAHDAALKKIADTPSGTGDDSDAEIANQIKRDRIINALGDEYGEGVLENINAINETSADENIPDDEKLANISSYFEEIEKYIGDSNVADELRGLVDELTNNARPAPKTVTETTTPVVTPVSTPTSSTTQGPKVGDVTEEGFTIGDRSLLIKASKGTRVVIRDSVTGEDVYELYQIVDTSKGASTKWKMVDKTNDGKPRPGTFTADDVMRIVRRQNDPQTLKQLNNQGTILLDNKSELPEGFDTADKKPESAEETSETTETPAKKPVDRFKEAMKKIDKLGQIKEDIDSVGSYVYQENIIVNGRKVPQTYEITAESYADYVKEIYDELTDLGQNLSDDDVTALRLQNTEYRKEIDRIQNRGGITKAEKARLIQEVKDRQALLARVIKGEDFTADAPEPEDSTSEEGAPSGQTAEQRFDQLYSFIEDFERIQSDIREVGNARIVNASTGETVTLDGEDFDSYVSAVLEGLTELGQRMSPGERGKLRAKYEALGESIAAILDGRGSAAQKKAQSDSLKKKRAILAKVLRGEDVTLQGEDTTTDSGESTPGGGGGKRPPGGGKKPAEEENWWADDPSLVEEELPINSRTDFNAPIFQDKQVRKLIDAQRRLELSHREYNRIRKLIEQADEMGIVSRANLLRDFNFWRANIQGIEREINGLEGKLNTSIKDIEDRINAEMESGDYLDDKGNPYSPTADRYADGPVGSDPRSVMNAWKSFKEVNFMPLKVDDIISNIDYLEDRVRQAWFDARKAQEDPNASASDKAAAFANFQRAEKERSEFVTDSYKYRARLNPEERALWDRWAARRSIQIRKMYGEDQIVDYIKHIEFYGGLLPLHGFDSGDQGQGPDSTPSGVVALPDGTPSPGSDLIPQRVSRVEDGGDSGTPQSETGRQSPGDSGATTTDGQPVDYLRIPVEEFDRLRKEALKKFQDNQIRLQDAVKKRDEFVEGISSDGDYLTDEERSTLAQLKQDIEDARQAQDEANRVITEMVVAARKRSDRGKPTKEEADQVVEEEELKVMSVDDLNESGPGTQISIEENGNEITFAKGSDGFWYLVGSNDRVFTESYFSSDDLAGGYDLENNAEFLPDRNQNIPLAGIGSESITPATSTPTTRNRNAKRNRVKSAEALDKAPTGTRISRDVFVDPEDGSKPKKASLNQFEKGEDGLWYPVSEKTGKRLSKPVSTSQMSSLVDEIDDGIISISPSKQSLRDAISEQSSQDGGTGAASRREGAVTPVNQPKKSPIKKIGGHEAKTWTPQQVAKKIGFTPSPEQLKIINDFGQGESMLIVARAGTGKTTTLEMLSRLYPENKILLAAYNTAIADEAAARFGRNTQARTIHSLGWFGADVGLPAGQTLNAKLDLSQGKTDGRQAKLDSESFFTPAEAAEAFGIEQLQTGPESSILPTLIYANILTGISNGFASSVDRKINIDHLLPHFTDAIRKEIAKNPALGERYAQIAQDMWDSNMSVPITIQDRIAFNGLTGKDMKVIPVSNSALTKMWQLSGTANVATEVPGGKPVDTLFIDETQDLDAAMIDLLTQLAKPNADGERLQIVVVGDNRQALYAFRGAVNQVYKFYDETESSLTESKNTLSLTRRSPEAIVQTANIVLWLDGEEVRTTSLVDKETKATIYAGDLSPEVLAKLTPEIREAIERAGDAKRMPLEKADAIFEETNSALINWLPALAKLGRRVALNANRRDEFIVNIEALSLMAQDPQNESRKRAFKDRKMGVFQDYPEYKLYGKGGIWDQYTGGGGNLSSAVKTFLKIANEHDLLFNSSTDVKSAEFDAEGKETSPAVIETTDARQEREKMLRLVRQTVVPQPSYIISQQSLFAEELDNQALNIPESNTEVEGNEEDYSGSLIPGVLDYEFQKANSGKVNLRVSGSRLARDAFAQRLARAKRDLIANPETDSDVVTELEAINFNSSDSKFEGFRIMNLIPGSNTVELLLDEASKERRRIEPIGKDRMLEQITFPTAKEFEAAGGKPIARKFYRSTNAVVRGEDGAIQFNPPVGNNKPTKVRTEAEVEILFERDDINNVVSMSIVDSELQYQTGMSPHNPLDGSSLELLGFSNVYRSVERSDTPIPGAYSPPTPAKPLTGLDNPWTEEEGTLISIGTELSSENGVISITPTQTYVSNGDRTMTLLVDGKRIGNPRTGEQIIAQTEIDLKDSALGVTDMFYTRSFTQKEVIRPGGRVMQMSAVEDVAKERLNTLLNGSDLGDALTDSMGYDVSLLTIHGAKGLEFNNVILGSTIAAFWVGDGDSDGDESEGEGGGKKKKLRELTDEEIMQKANMLYVALSRARESMDIGSMSALYQVAAVYTDILAERGIDPKDFPDYEIWSVKSKPLDSDFFIEAYNKLLNKSNSEDDETPTVQSRSRSRDRNAAAAERVPEGVNAKNPSVQTVSPGGVTTTHYFEFPELGEEFDDSPGWTPAIGETPIRLISGSAYSEDDIREALESILGDPDLLQPKSRLPESAGKLKGKRTTPRGLYEALVLKKKGVRGTNPSDAVVEARRDFAEMFDRFGGDSSRADALDKYLTGTPVAEESTPEQPSAPRAPRARRPRAIPAPAPDATPDATPAAPETKPARESIADRVARLRLQAEQNAGAAESEGTGAGSRRAPTTGQSQLSPDTMAEIFDRYALLAQYRKAISEGRMSIPLEYSAGGVANRYNASIEEIIQALELMGFTPDELA